MLVNGFFMFADDNPVVKPSCRLLLPLHAQHPPRIDLCLQPSHHASSSPSSSCEGGAGLGNNCIADLADGCADSYRQVFLRVQEASHASSRSLHVRDTVAARFNHLVTAGAHRCVRYR